MNNHDRHYLTLGLQRGATQEEIDAAFQRMSVKYHPDNDSSLDAQMKFHEARQAYDALSDTTGTKTSGTTAGTQQPGGTGRYTFDDDELDDIIEDLAMTPEQKDVLPTVSLNDYFFRIESIFIVIGSALLFFWIERLALPFPITPERSMRYSMHMTVVIVASWLIIGNARLTNPSRANINFIIVLSGIAHASLLYFLTLRQEFLQFISIRGIVSRDPFNLGAVKWSAFVLFVIFYCAMRLLDSTLKNRLRKRKRSRA